MQIERAVKIDADDRVPEDAIGFQKGDRDIPAGDIGKQLNRPSLSFELVRRAGDSIAIGDIDLKGQHSAGLADAQMRRLLGTRQILVEDADDAALIGQPERRRPSDPAGPAGQNRPSAMESAHINLPVCFIIVFERNPWRIVSPDRDHVNIGLHGRDLACFTLSVRAAVDEVF
jgi:hypothetical protein